MMYLRYILHILKELIGKIIAYFIYPISYIFRNFWRKNILNPYCYFFWLFLNDEYDYGDEYFYNKWYKGNSWWQMFVLSYRWAAMRNALQNYYWEIGIDQDDIDIEYLKWNVTCHRDCSPFMWRTIKTKDIDDNYQDKHGNYIDYSQAILGKQNLILLVNNKKYFRNSYANIFYLKKLNRFLWFEYKFGFEKWNWAWQFHIMLKKTNEKSIEEFYNYKDIDKICYINGY